MPSNDPKHGRWILPLIIGAMVLLTYIFVTNLEPTPEAGAGATTTTEAPPFETTPTSSTSTLPPELAAFMVTIDVFEQQATGFGQQVTDINNDWEARSILFSEARTQFNNVRSTVELWEQQVADAAADAPAPLAETYVTFVTATEDLAPAIEDIVLGLEAPDDGTLRRTAVEIYAQEIQQVLDAIADIRAAAEAAGAPADGGDPTEGDGENA